jgi:hypothetical protein
MSFFNVGTSPRVLRCSDGWRGKGIMFDFPGGFPEGIVGSGCRGEIFQVVLEVKVVVV